MPSFRRVSMRIAVVLASVIVGVSGAYGDDLPKGEEIIEKYLTAVGGTDALGKLKNRVSKGTIVIPEMGMSGTLTTHQAPPMDGKVEVVFEGMGTILTGTKGEVAWEVSPMTGARVMEGNDKIVAYRQVPLDPFIDWKTRFEKVETTGEDTEGETPAYIVTLTPKEGPPEVAYFDKESGLLLKIETAGENGATFTRPFGDYKEVDGVKVAHSTGLRGGQFNFDMTFETVEHNTEIAADVFDLPDVIKTILEGPKEGGNEKK